MAVYETATQANTNNTTSIDLTNAHFVTPTNSDGKTLVFKTRTEAIEGTLPISKGGTGITDLDGGKLIASNETGELFEEVDIPVSAFKGLQGNIQDQIDSKRTYTVTVPTSGWTSITGGFKQTVTVSGITGDDNPLVGLKTTGTNTTTISNEKYAFSCLDRVETTTNAIVLYCYSEKPSINITLQLTCV